MHMRRRARRAKGKQFLPYADKWATWSIVLGFVQTGSTVSTPQMFDVLTTNHLLHWHTAIRHEAAAGLTGVTAHSECEVRRLHNCDTVWIGFQRAVDGYESTHEVDYTYLVITMPISELRRNQVSLDLGPHRPAFLTLVLKFNAEYWKLTGRKFDLCEFDS
jgi:hypothetical protein